jgi:hypothetical protein
LRPAVLRAFEHTEQFIDFVQVTDNIMREKLFSKIVSTRFSSQSLAGYLAETRQDIGEMTGLSV